MDAIEEEEYVSKNIWQKISEKRKKELCALPASRNASNDNQDTNEEQKEGQVEGQAQVEGGEREPVSELLANRN